MGDRQRSSHIRAQGSSFHPRTVVEKSDLVERRRKPGSDLVLILRSFRDGFRGSFAGTVLSFAATCVS